MRALVIYESMFGNTQEVARAIAAGLATHAEVEVVEVGDAPTSIGEAIDLVVVGAPTHAFGLSREETRRSAAEQASDGVVSDRIGLREWLATATTRPGVTAAAFDTRVDHPRVPGSAAAKAQRRLRRLGFLVISAAQSFHVDGTTGPLIDGEVQRARTFGEQLGLEAVTHLRPTPAGA